MPGPARDITALLREASDEAHPLPRTTADRIFALAYEELRSVAQREMSKERACHTLQPTALLNEVYLRLVDASQVRWENRAHFFGIAAQAMRQVLVEHARRRRALKRGRGWKRVMITESGLLAHDPEIDAVDIEILLERLARLHPRMARVVELRVFGGLTGAEISLLLGVSRKTVQDDWRVAALWLRAEMSGEAAPPRTPAIPPPRATR